MLTVDYGRLGLKPGDRVLDLGCGFGRHAYEVLRRGAAVVACDLGIDELRQVRGVVAAMYLDGEIPETASVGTAAGDATSMPFDDDSFDHVIASEVLEHIHDDDGALAGGRASGDGEVETPLGEEVTGAVNGNAHDHGLGEVREAVERVGGCALCPNNNEEKVDIEAKSGEIHKALEWDNLGDVFGD